MALDLASFDARLRTLEDIEEIRRLRMKYHLYMNEQQFHRIVEVFTEDAVVDFGELSRARGADEIRDLFKRIPRHLSMVKQFIHNHIVDVTGDTATGISFLDARYAQAGESVMVAAKFDEDYVRTQAGWRVKEMRLGLYFSVPISVGWAGQDVNFVKPFT
jgi:ketosteroid isomerase-like protein